jgi:uncharacterized protein YodC (DUF2158 family)
VDQTKYVMGDVVILNSGGPHMSVIRYSVEDGCTYVACVWFNKDGSVATAGFPELCIRLITKASEVSE